jgi:hypothetical protein
MATKKYKKRQSVNKVKKVEEKITWSSRNPILAVFIKVGIISSILVSFLYYSDSKGWFNPDFKNNHTIRKWNAFYDFSENHNVDVLLVGNSHLYTGINPKHLSAGLGCNAFILASPGTHIDDHYFAIKEALTKCKPSVLVLETYGLKKINPKEKKEGSLSDQFKSFSARKNVGIKLASTPYLFAVKNYPYAWSNTLRNHNFLYTNYEQIKKNRSKKDKFERSKNKLYLGRYVRFQTGVTDSILSKYKEDGAPVNGENYQTNALQAEYFKRITTLCEEQGIALVLLTLPMHEQHVSNYPAWKEKLSQNIGETYATNEYWLDMQIGKGYVGFSEKSFENTYKSNQHMTFEGSMVATYKLIDFIQSKERITLPNRRNDNVWRDVFYGEEGFFENNTPRVGDSTNVLLYTTTDKTGMVELIILKKAEHYTVVGKYIPNKNEKRVDLEKNMLSLNIRIKTVNNQVGNTVLNLPFDKYHSLNKRLNFATNIKPIEIQKVNSIQLIPNPNLAQ